MNTNLEIFEKKFTATNLKNGLSYWKKDLFNVIEDSPSVLEANIYGENEYTTTLKFANAAIVDVNCTCPNHRTLFCKHVAALYYEKFKAVFKFKKTAARQAKKKPLNTGFQNAEATVNNLSIEQLKDIVVFSMQQNKEVKAYVETIASAKKPLKTELYKLYFKSLKTLIKNNTKHYFISETATNKIGKQALKYLEQAELFFENNDNESGIYICRAILEALLTYIYEASIGVNSDYSNAIDSTLQEVSLVINAKNSNSKLKKIVFTFLFNLLQKEEVLYSSYEIPILKLIVTASATVSEKNKLFTFLEKNITSTYKVQEYYLITNTLIEKYDGSEAAKNHLNNNLIIPLFREKIYNELIENKNYKEAKTLIKEGLIINEEDFNTKIKWYKKLLFIAEQTNDNVAIVDTSAILFLNIVDFEESFKYYHIFKAQFSKTEWKKQLQKLLTLIESEKKLQEVYLIEGLINELIKSVSNNANTYWAVNLLPFSNNQLDVLLPDYEAQVLKIFEANLKVYLDIYKGRSYYKSVCESIIKIKKRGVDVSSCIAFIKEHYYRRPSLLNCIDTYFL